MDIEKRDNKVIIKIPLEDGRFWQKEYFRNDLIESVAKDFKAENQVDLPQNYFLDWNFKNKPLKMTDKIESLLNQEIPTICLNKEIKKKPLNINYEDVIPDLVGKPFNDPFEVFLFAKDDKSLKIQTYDPITVNNLELNNYSPSSSYCNGNNHLFISGGEKKDGEIIGNFWEIDLKVQNIAEPIKIPPKKNHSMIFIPNNYVFIVGGNDKKTFYINTENAEVCEWGNLNKIRTEPALQRMSNILYCFDNINKGDNDIFTLEKTDLNSNKPEWILLTPKFNFNMDNELKLNQKFFGVSKDEEENIIFLGGNIDNYKKNEKRFNYKYNINLNTIELSNVPYRKYNFKEKTFLTYRKNIYYILPDFNKQHPEVVFFVKKNNRIEAIDYEPKLNAQLKSLKPPLPDFKYDFNMPTVAIPDPVTEFNLDQQHINTEQQNIFNTNIKMNINDPSFQDNNYKNTNENNEVKTDYINKNNINIISNFKEPEIEPTKEDLKLSLDINKDILRNNPKINLKTRDNNNNIIINPSNNINQNIENNILYTNIPNNNNAIYIPKFHFNTNDPGNQLNVIPKGNIKISTNSSQNQININPNLNDLKNPKNEEKGSKNVDSSLSGVISGNVAKIDGNKISNNYKIDFNKDLIITGTIKGTKEKNKNVSNNKKTNNENCISGFIPGIKLPKTQYDLKTPNTSNININPNIKVDVKGPKINDTNIDINENIPEINVNNPKINIESNNNLTNQNYNLKGRIPIPDINSSNKIEVSNPKMPTSNMSVNIPGPKINTSNIDISLKDQSNYNINNDISIPKLETSKININPGKIEINAPKQIIPDYNLNGNIPGTKLSSSKQNISSTKINLNQDFKLSGVIKGTKNDKSISTDINANNHTKMIDYNLNGNIPGIKVKNQKKNTPSNEITTKEPKNDFYLSGVIKGKKNLSKKKDIPKGEIKSKESKINVPNLNLSKNINTNAPTVNLKIENHNNNNMNIKEEVKINVPNYDIHGNINGTQLNGKTIDTSGPKIDTNINKIENNTELNINMQANPPPKYNLQQIIAGTGNEINKPKLEITNTNININNPNINLNEDIIPDYDISGKIEGIKINKPNKMFKDENIVGTIPGIKNNELNMPKSNFNVNLNNPNTIEIKNPNIQLPSTTIETKNINMNQNIQNVNITPIKANISPINLNVNPLEAEFSQNNQINQIGKFNKGLDYNISGNIPGVKVTKLNANSNTKSEDFCIQGIIPSSNNKINTNKIVNYKINRPDVQLTNYNTYNKYNTFNTNSVSNNVLIGKNFHGNINDVNYMDFHDNDVKGPRRIFNSSTRYNNNINLNNKVILNNEIKNNPQNINSAIKNMQISNNENLNISSSQNIMEKSNNEFFPHQIINDNPEMNNMNKINNNNIQTSNFNYKIDNNNIENTIELKANNNNELYSINNGNNINIEMPEVDMKFNSNNINPIIPKIETNNDNNNHKLTQLRFHTIKEESKEINYEDENAHYGSHRGNSKKKNSDLPLVGIKNNSFKTSKDGTAGNLNTENIDINNLKAANVGVNGIKIGDRIIE